MTTRDHDTKPLESFASLPVYLPQCDLQRARITQAVNDSIDDIDYNATWLRRLLYALVFTIGLGIAALAIAAKTHYDLKRFLKTVKSVTAEYEQDTPAEGP